MWWCAAAGLDQFMRVNHKIFRNFVSRYNINILKLACCIYALEIKKTNN